MQNNPFEYNRSHVIYRYLHEWLQASLFNATNADLNEEEFKKNEEYFNNWIRWQFQEKTVTKDQMQNDMGNEPWSSIAEVMLINNDAWVAQVTELSRLSRFHCEDTLPATGER